MTVATLDARHRTPAVGARQTDGDAVAAFARLRGREMAPWARHAALVLGERTPEGRMAHPVAVVLVPRQCGKTTLAFDLALGRCLEHRDYHAAYTAQTGHATTERFRELFDDLGDAAAKFRAFRSQGMERLDVVPRSGSFLRAFPPLDRALRGSVLDLVICDEAQEHSDELGAALDAMIVPTMQTRPRRQIVLLGTAGCGPGWMRRYYERAAGGAGGYALFDYGAADTVDPGDEGVWWQSHPGLASGLTDADAMRMALDVMGADQFRREYLNIWSDVAPGARDQPIPLAAWDELATKKVRHTGERVLGFDVSPDRTRAAVAGASRGPDGVVSGDLLWQGPAKDLPGQVGELCAGASVRSVVGAPSQADVAARLRSADCRTNCVTGGEYAAACQRLADLVQAGRVRHSGSPVVAACLAGAVRGWMRDAWVWSARGSGADITPLVALTLAVAGADRVSAPVMV